jgi:hypothetical protein
VALIGLLAGITFPAISAGVDSLRLTSASDSIVSFFNEGLNRAERRQQVVEVSISKSDRALSMHSSEPGFERKLDLPEGISVVAVLPELPQNDDAPRHFLLYPGGAVPRFGIEIANSRDVHRIVRVDPITGVPQVEQVEK